MEQKHILIIVPVVSILIFTISQYEFAHGNNSTVQVLIDKGDTLTDLGNYEEAITYYDKALAIDHNNSSALYNKSLALAGLGRLKESLAYYSKALDIDSNSIITPNNNDSILDSIRH